MESICLSFRMKHISPLWLAYAQEITKVLERRKTAKRRKETPFLKGALTESAWAASKTKATYYIIIYHNIVRRRSKKRALVALAHRMLIDIYYVLKTGEPYQDVGAKAVHERKLKRREQSMIRSLERARYLVAKAATA